MLRSKTSTIIIHLAGWLIFLSLPFLLFPAPLGNQNVLNLLSSLNYWLFYFFYVFLFYFNAYFLIPAIYFKKKYALYTLIIVALFMLVYFLKQPTHTEPPLRTFQPERSMEMRRPPPDFNRERRPPRPFRVNLVTVFLFTMVWALSTAFRITQQWAETERRATKAEADKANAELSFLKAQINPHFLFNTLNNIYLLAIKKNENTPASIMKLSNLMRYVTEDTNQHFVPLDEEINCIRDYIDLQRLRLSNKVELDFQVKGNTENKAVPPLLFITFIENVFKYGISNHEPSTINIHLFAEDKTITFYCRNKIFQTKTGERTGIGIENTKKRLGHLYAGKHVLNITTEKDYFTVELILPV